MPGETKEQILELIDDAVRAGAAHGWACSLLGVSDDRAHRWRRRRRETGTVEDRPPGGVALHALRPAEVAEILALTEQWGPVDRSRRKLAHRGSYEGRVWVSASTLRRTLAAAGLVLSEPPARDPAPRVLWPDWLRWEPNKIWCWDVTHFPRARRAAFAIVDVVSRRWIDTLVSTEETSTQVRVIFDRALAAEGLAELITPERVEQFSEDPTRPILLACSDNGPQMTSTATRDLFAALAVAQRLRRPRTPTDQAWIESLFGHIKTENPQQHPQGTGMSWLIDGTDAFAEIAGGGVIPPSVLEEYFCGARIKGVVFSHEGLPLWHSHAKRLATKAQVSALRALYGACAGCGADMWVCQGHHIKPVPQGGPTNIDNMMLLCWACHQKVHHHSWQVVPDGRGLYTIAPPERIHYGPAHAPTPPRQPTGPRPSRRRGNLGQAPSPGRHLTEPT